MKTLGLIGGTTWVSTADYYKLINKEVSKELGGHHSARLILYSVDFQEALSLQESGDFEGLGKLLQDAALALKRAGVDGIMICANTLHKYAVGVKTSTGLPMVHIVDETALIIKRSEMTTVGLLGTRPTMTESFYLERMKEHGIRVIVPDENDREFLHRTIIDELSYDIFKDTSRKEIMRIMDVLRSQGTEGIILGCTELPLIIKPEHTELPLFDTLQIHAKAAARFIATD